MFKQFLSQVTGLDIYLIISLFIFLLFFLGVGLWLLTKKKADFDEVSHLPLINDKCV
jgi:cbb3-type cytochrome oxidase subunit 3